MQTTIVSALTQFAAGDGMTKTFSLGTSSQVVAGAVVVSLTNNGAAQAAPANYSLGAGGLVTFVTAPAVGASLQWTGIYQWNAAANPLWQQTLMSQFANSPTMLQLLQNLSGYIEPQPDIANLLSNIWNILTAQGFGLDIWGRILGVKRILQVSGVAYFGLEGSTGPNNASGDSFGGGPAPTAVAPFYVGAPTTSNYALADTPYRTLLLGKALANITNGTPQAINQLLVNLFILPVAGRTGNAFVTDLLNMNMTYTFTLRPALTPVEVAIVSQSGVLPRPTGVTATVIQL